MMFTGYIQVVGNAVETGADAARCPRSFALTRITMSFSMGWLCLFGGVVGALRVSTAKKFYKSDFENSDGIIAEEDYRTEVPITPLKRWIFVGICLLVASIGAFKIQQDRNWNPFESGAKVASVSVR
jgi:hypothetical protein